MILNSANLKAATKGFRALFTESLAGVATPYQTLAMVIDGASPEEVYNWLAALPRMREWIGERYIKELAAHDYTIKKKDWEATISVSRDDILFDKLGLVKPRIQQLAQASAEHYMDLIISLVIGGFIQTCYDGQYFFDTDHPEGSNCTDKKLAATSYNDAYAAMSSQVDEEGRALNTIPTHLVYPPQLRATALEILKAQTDQYGKSNINQGSAEPLMLPQLAAHPTKWFLLDLSKPVKPFILQLTKGLEFVAKDTPDDDNVFFRKEFYYGVDCMDNAGYGLWQLAYGSTGTVA